MAKKLPDNIFLPELEKEVLEFWKKDNTFRKSIDEKDSEKSFTFYEGPPTANGLPGIHHVLARTIKDLVCRYKTMQGYKVERKAGWDTQGLPVEVEVEKTLGIKSKADIVAFGEIKFNQECKNSVFKYLKEWEDLTSRMGYWIDLSNAYITFHNEYIESVWWALKKFFDAGLIYKGYKILPFCPVCESPLSSHEVAQGYQDLKDPSVFVKFKITTGQHAGSDFLVWTTTPWTLPSNAALAVNPVHKYVKISTAKGDVLILAKERLEVISEEYNIEEEFEGSSLEGTDYEQLFKFLEPEGKAFFVTPGDFVTMEDGSGIVHIAPAFGEDDYQTGLKYSLPVFKAVGKDGKFVEALTPFKGMNFKEADTEIIADLKLRGRLYRKEMFVHSYPHCWRHHVPLMYYATDSWFVNTTSYKSKMIELNNTINWNPETFGSGRFGNWLEENRDWAISRNRFWGTPLPVWSYEDENGKEVHEMIGSIEELRNRAENFDEVYKDDASLDLHKPYIDDIVIKSKDGKKMHRVKEVIDCWFDSGSMPFAQHHYPFENQELFKENYPADFISEGLDQTRGWFYSLHAIGTFLFEKPAYKNLIVNGMILDKNGKKMSKSLGNVVNPFDMMKKYGADVLRWYLISSSPVGNSKLFDEEDLVEIQNKFFDTVINTIRFYFIYSEIAEFEYDEDEATDITERETTDRWIISKMNSLKKNYFELMDDYDITKASRIVQEFAIDELSNWYVRRNRKRFRNPANRKDLLHGYQTLHEVILELLKMIAPFSPFLSDKLFMIMNDNTKSIHLTEFSDFDPSAIDERLEEEMHLAQNIVYLARSVRVKNNLKVRQPLRQILVPVLNDTEKEMLLNIKSIVLEEVNIKELNIIEGDSNIIVKKAKPNFKSIGPKFGKDVKEVQKAIMALDSVAIRELETANRTKAGNFEITRDDVELFTENIEGWIVDSHDDVTIALDTKLDSGLIEEGIVREFINRVQNFRRSANFEISDTIEIFLDAPELIRKAIDKNLEYILSETMSSSISHANGSDYDYLDSEINGQAFKIFINKEN
jgi:isoleucyl-tRNA synthetase